MQVLPAWNAVDVAVAGTRSRFDIRVDLSEGIVSWDPQGLGQTAYQADVEVEHWLACEFVGQIYKTEKIEFNEELPADATSFHLPGAKDPSLTLVKVLTFNVKAADTSGCVLETNDSAVQVLGDETLRDIARQLVETVRNNVTIDWTLRENVRANLRRLVRRILRKHGYPPDKQEKATQTVLEQAEILSGGWATA